MTTLPHNVARHAAAALLRSREPERISVAIENDTAIKVVWRQIKRQRT